MIKKRDLLERIEVLEEYCMSLEMTLDKLVEKKLKVKKNKKNGKK